MGGCNNGVLSKLDAYGRTLYDNFFQRPAYRGETTDFACDYALLVRWLLKLCFNSARVHDADTTILQKYAGFILGEMPMPGDVAIYVQLVSPTDLSTGIPTASQRIIGDPDSIGRPEWFRITQIRADVESLTDVVQRQIYIDSYCFTIFVCDPSHSKHLAESKHVQAKFLEYMPSATLLPESGFASLRAGAIHEFEAGADLITNYPTRYLGQAPSGSESFSDSLKQLIDGDAESAIILISRNEIEVGDVCPTVDRLHDMVLTRESALATMQRIALLIHGYDDEPKALWDFPEVREWVIRMFEECPHYFFLARPGSTSLEMVAACYCREDRSTGGKLFFDPERVKAFLELGFDGLNEVTQRLAISVEHNKRISEYAFAVLDSFIPPGQPRRSNSGD